MAGSLYGQVFQGGCPKKEVIGRRGGRGGGGIRLEVTGGRDMSQADDVDYCDGDDTDNIGDRDSLVHRLIITFKTIIACTVLIVHFRRERWLTSSDIK